MSKMQQQNCVGCWEVKEFSYSQQLGQIYVPKTKLVSNKILRTECTKFS